MNVCFSYHRIFQLEKFNKIEDRNESIDESSFDNLWYTTHSLFDRLTVDDILKYTPDTNEVIEECYLRSTEKDKISSRYY